MGAIWNLLILNPFTNVLLWIYSVLGHGTNAFGVAIILFTILIRLITWPLNGQLYSLNTSDGSNAWAAVQPDGPITASLLLRTDGVIAATESGSLYAFDHNGARVWNASLIEAGKGGTIYTTPVASGNLILDAPLSADFLLAAVNQNGGLVWKFTGK